MHEVGITQNIVAIVAEYANNTNVIEDALFSRSVDNVFVGGQMLLAHS